MVNKVFVMGHLTADPEVRATPSGVQVANLRLATNNYGGKDEAGNRKEQTEYHRLVFFGRQAEIAGEYLRKGRLVHVEGRLHTSSWEDLEGKKQWSTEIIGETMQMVGSKPPESN